jgi:hypothetical protein
VAYLQHRESTVVLMLLLLLSMPVLPRSPLTPYLSVA